MTIKINQITKTITIKNLKKYIELHVIGSGSTFEAKLMYHFEDEQFRFIKKRINKLFENQISICTNTI